MRSNFCFLGFGFEFLIFFVECGRVGKQATEMDIKGN